MLARWMKKCVKITAVVPEVPSAARVPMVILLVAICSLLLAVVMDAVLQGMGVMMPLGSVCLRVNFMIILLLCPRLSLSQRRR